MNSNLEISQIEKFQNRTRKMTNLLDKKKEEEKNE